MREKLTDAERKAREKAEKRAYYLAHRDRLLAKQRAYYAANKERLTAARNSDAGKEVWRAWYSARRVEYLERLKERYPGRRSEIMARQAAYRARKRVDNE